MNLRERAVRYISRQDQDFVDVAFAITRHGTEEIVSIQEYLGYMGRPASYAEGPIIEATGMVLECQIDLIELVPGVHGEAETTQGRFRAAAVQDLLHTILLLRVNNNHYHATGCPVINSFDAANKTSASNIKHGDTISSSSSRDDFAYR